MGWNWSVYWAVDLAEQLPQKAQKQMVEAMGQQTTSLNITKKGCIEISDGPFQGCYIDNLFSMGVDPVVVNMVQKFMTQEFEKHGLVMSEDSGACTERKLLGVLLQGEQNKISPSEKFLQEIAYIAKRKRIRVWEFDKIMGKCAWIFPLHRRFLLFCQKVIDCSPMFDGGWKKEQLKKIT